MLRRWSTVALAAILTMAFAQSPFAHLHPGDPDHHHATGFVHTHLELDHDHAALDPGEGLEFETDDHHEASIDLQWAPTQAQRIDVPAIALLSFTTPLPPTYISAGIAPEFAPRAHSPPTARLLPARAPPA